MNDPRTIIDEGPMGRLQWTAVGIAAGLNALDGFDVLAISFASPGIAAEWGIDRAALGVVLSMELIGMALGSVLLGGVCDRIGRRRMVLGCLAVMTVGMFMAGQARSIADLSAWRVLTGLGIGGMLPAINTIAAEYSSAKRRNAALALVVIGYPIGAGVGGTIAGMLLEGGDWRVVFDFGGFVTLAFVPLVWFLVPETVQFHAFRRPKDALARINRTLARMGHAVIAALPEPGPAQAKASIADLFRPALIATTLLLMLAYFAHVITFYFILKWVPKIVVDMGFSPSSAADVLVWASFGGALGGAVFGLLAQKLPLKGLTVTAMFAGSAMVVAFGNSPPSIAYLSAIVGVTGFFTNAAIAGFYTIMARAFPTHVRASGTGLVIGVSRGGSVIAPILAGVLLEGGLGVPLVAMVMGSGSLIAALVLLTLRLRLDPPERESGT